MVPPLQLDDVGVENPSVEIVVCRANSEAAPGGRQLIGKLTILGPLQADHVMDDAIRAPRRCAHETGKRPADAAAKMGSHMQYLDHGCRRYVAKVAMAGPMDSCSDELEITGMGRPLGVAGHDLLESPSVLVAPFGVRSLGFKRFG